MSIYRYTTEEKPKSSEKEVRSSTTTPSPKKEVKKKYKQASEYKSRFSQ